MIISPLCETAAQAVSLGREANPEQGAMKAEVSHFRLKSQVVAAQLQQAIDLSLIP
jgi:hypothetical protein